MKEFNIAYLCDRKVCEVCDDELCSHTTDITHAKNFKSLATLVGDYFYEKESSNTINLNNKIQDLKLKEK